MVSPVERGRARVDGLRRRWPLLDRGVQTQEHYTAVNGSALAGGVTYYGFLSFFPLLALAFFVVGRLATVYPEARDNLITWIDQAMPGIVGTDPGEISINTIEQAATTVGVLGALGLLYTGLGWLSMMRKGLQEVFDVPRTAYPSFVGGKLRDLVTLVVLGVVLVLSVGLTGLVVGFSGRVLDLLGLGHELAWVVAVLGAAVAVATNTVLFYALFEMLARPPLSRSALRNGALVGGVVFEVLKEASTFLLGLTQKSPAFQAFGIALILLVWISYFSRLVMYAAAWAHTAPSARVRVEAEAEPPPPRRDPDVVAAPHRRADPRVAFGAGAATAVALMAALRRRRTR